MIIKKNKNHIFFYSQTKSPNNKVLKKANQVSQHEGINLTQSVNDEFVITESKADNTKRNAICAAVRGAVLAGLTLITAIKIPKIKFFGTKYISEVSKRMKIFEEQMKPFPKDIQYRKSMLKDLGLKPRDYSTLRPIIGSEELISIVKGIGNDSAAYMPGIISYEGGKVKFHNKKNVNSHTYRANLHIHTRYSDGQLTVPELLEQAVKYADEVAEKNPFKNPFVIAITDHDAVQGCKDAVEIVRKDPWKFRNLRIVLGIENSTLHQNEHGKDLIHLLAYCINPNEKGLQAFMGEKLHQYQQNIRQVLQNANNKYSSILSKNKFQYNFEDAKKVAPCFESSTHNTGYMKDYLQFRLVYAHTIENNIPLIDFMKQNGVEHRSLDFAEARDCIPTRKLDYSKGQTYYGYYYEALKEHVTSVIKEKKPTIDEKKLATKFIEISPEIRVVLDEIELDCNNRSDLRVQSIKPHDFSHTVETLAKLNDGVMAIAHPGVDLLRQSENRIAFMSDVFNIFKAKGQDRAKFAEDYYQVYYKNTNRNLIDELSKLSSKFALLKTGSLDTHGKNIFED